ncbi:voltage-gated chloride channel [Aspergillus sclerotiicarbonarius CBS 121057]|uniref:Chloride channel protein n=1 Tax=Aspergillus sclerotiicarbonarius (strain CBS 121057 / IBT 28362) TaxID=1448318 RepID=A0A319FA85_ASPSB|nr:voltage-gated chloride channel [Aspergillus sclerotiicarbonarius CBS 121057]
MSAMPASSPSARPPSLLPERRNWRRFSGLSVVSPISERPTPDNGQPPAITEEISEIKRYEDFTTIDWVQDAVHEQARRRAKRRDGSGFWDQEGTFGWRRKVRESYDAGQAWLVITIVGAAIGLISAFLNIITEWLSDVKLGHCTTAFYLNEQFCCWGAEGGCPEWRPWTSYWIVNYFIYIFYAILFAFVAASLVKSFAPYAAGSGISEIKCIIAGFVMKGFLGAWTLLIKSIALPLAIASGLSVGKEGPSVHFAVCTGNVISRFFSKYKQNASKTREVLTATAAAGVAVAFGSPIGGVLFSLEEVASYFPLKTLWRSYFCALVATGILAVMNPFRTGQLVMFQVQYDRTWHFFELIFFIFLGVFGGLYGALVIKWNLRVQAFRKKYLSQHAVMESVVLAGITAILCYPNMFLKINMTEMMEILFRECEGGHDYNGLCESKNRWSMVMSLAVATLLRVFLVIISYGCKVPAGIFVPSMAVGASFGRFVGILVQALHEAYPKSKFFASCEPDIPCITPGTYAFLGAGAALSGIMHLTISVTVIMFELTGALNYILPTMIVVGVTKAVSDCFGKGGIADRMIWSNGFPFLDNKEDHVFNVPVSQAMTSDPVSLPASGFPVREAEHLLSDNKFQGFPIVEDRTRKTLVGYIGRTELRYAINRAKAEGLLSPSAKCIFTKEAVEASVARRASSASHLHPETFDDIQTNAGASYVDFSRYADHTPLTVHPRLALETVMEIFKKMGPRVILVEHRGRLTGLVTVKDCLKYQFKVEAEEQALAATSPPQLSLGGQNGRSSDTLEERLWNLMQRIGSILPWQRTRRDQVAPEREPTPRPAPSAQNDVDEAHEAMLELEER